MLNLYRLRQDLRQRLKRSLQDLRGYRLHELPSINVDFSQAEASTRLNLVVLGIRRNSIWGGTDTALRFFEALRPRFARARLMVLKETERDFEPAEWEGWALESRQPDAPQTIAFLAQSGFRARLDKNEYFIVTHWLTAFFIQGVNRLVSPQKSAVFPYVYLIQDFEPGFYPWSGRFLVALGTYQAAAPATAIFNTNLLADFFKGMSVEFRRQFVFEPRLNPKLAQHRRRLVGHTKRRLLLVYGRPGTSRNAFDLAVEALICWAQQYPSAPEWTVVSMGENHPDIVLSKGVTLTSKGKLSLDEYASQLLDASVGLSLMVSPHPSYPPLDMAEFGVRVVTNNFANKNMAIYSSNISSVSDPSPYMLADALKKNCEAFDRGERPDLEHTVFQGSADEFPFIDELAETFLNEGRTSVERMTA